MVFKIEKTKNYTVMSNYHLQDKNISFKAKGLLSFMLSLPEDWDYSLAGLVSVSKENTKAIRTILNELKDNGYLVIEQTRGDKGYYKYNYIIYEQPITIEKDKKSPDTQKGYAVEGDAEKGLQINTNIQNTEEQIDKSDKDDKTKKSSFFDAEEHNPHGACKCGCKEFIPETAVMDTWATSSVSPFINMKYGEDDERKFLYPMSMRSHAHEIIRTWTFYSIVKSLYHTGQVPWKDLMISGFVLAKKGEKISKSKNNAKMSPNDLLDTYGADMIRYWTASNKLGTDTWFDTKDIESSKRFMNKLWNSAKFVDMHIKDADLSEETELQSIDKWLISRCHETFEKYQQQMENYEMGLARQEIDKFFWNDLCDNYLEMAKERLYNPDNKYGDSQKAAQQTLATVFLEVLKMYSPFVPHITEYIYQELYKSKLKDELLSTSKFTELPYDKKYIEFGDAMKKVVGDVRKYKTERNLSMKEPIEELKISTSLDNIRCLRDSILDIQSCTRAEHIDVEKSDETEVTITGRNIEDSYVEDAIDAPVQEEAKVMKLVRKDKKNQ